MLFSKMNHKEYAPIVLRISLGIVFLWFGFTNIFNHESLIGYLPEFFYSLGISLQTILLFNGIFEIIFGTLLIIGLFTRVVAFILFLHLLSITFSLGYNDVAIRDFGLALASLSISLYGADKWCLDRKLRNK